MVIFLICVGIATSFWFLNALNKDYKVELSFPVKYTNLPKDKVLASNPPSHFILEVNAHGFSILRHKLSLSFSPLVFNVNEFTGKRMEQSDRSKFAISSRRFTDRISDQISNELRIDHIWPDTLYFNFDKIVQKKVKVAAQLNLEFKRQFYQNGLVQTRPDSILILGPQSVLDTIDVIYTKQQDYKEIDQTIQRNISLEETDNISLETKRVVLTIPVEEYTQKELEIPISIEGLPDSVKVNLFPTKAKLSFMAGLSTFNEIVETDFKASVSFQDIQKKQEKLQVIIAEQPANLQAVSITPTEVEYLIEK